MKNRFKALLRNMGILTISSFASKILVFLLVPLYTGILSTEEYGLYDLVLTTVGFIFPILTANIVDGIMRFALDESYSKYEIVTIGIRYLIRSVIIITSFLIVNHFWGLVEGVRGLDIYILLYYALYALNQFFVQLAKGMDKVKNMGIAGILSTFSMILFNVIFLLWFGWGLKGFIVANIFSHAVAIIYYFFGLKFWNYIHSLAINKVLERELLVYSVPLLCTTVGWWINSAADKYSVTWICGIAANGLLSIAYKIPSVINTIQSIFTQAWQISAIKEYDELDAKKFYGKTFSYTNIFMCVVCSWLIILSKPLANLLYANDFYEAWKYVPFLTISSVINTGSGIIGPILAAKKESKPMALSAVYGSITNVVLNIVLIYIIGIQGATIATVVSSFVIFIFRKRFAEKDLEIDDYHVTLATWGLLCIQGMVEVYVSSYIFEIIIMVILLWINRVCLKNIFAILIAVVKRR